VKKMSEKTVPIMVFPETRELLKGLKIHKNESFNDAILRLIEKVDR
jgi:predicted CopG family antitoxin